MAKAMKGFAGYSKVKPKKYSTQGEEPSASSGHDHGKHPKDKWVVKDGVYSREGPSFTKGGSNNPKQKVKGDKGYDASQARLKKDYERHKKWQDEQDAKKKKKKGGRGMVSKIREHARKAMADAIAKAGG